ncbi:PSD1 and planctomycete cytochrome C domain-containing protein [Schlesneria paludicola]|uniref:PSD1 and planctomycete cytochrome C domain-containing protein n=1 Tax=Schlesneria paludicola TaxID=360056 RepID=UPI00029A66C5|nr:PSD1 and planctomycete cytochrome C domain-containing protein [Schlesneria paludicola]
MPSFVRVAVALIFMTSLTVAADSPSTEQVEFFEKQVRPLLAEHCQACHGAKKEEAGLRLDYQAGFLKGTDSGPVAVPGNPQGSRLIQVLLYADNDTQMPPKGKLADEQIAVIRKWVEQGAVWPKDSAAVEASAQPHWAFQPAHRPEISREQGAQTQTPIDSFVVAKLREKELNLSAAADRYTLIRRATLDMWGIPPTFAQVQEFLQDTTPDHVERLIDRLLASPLYGQRWARHWLDVARYADSKGYVFTAEPRYPYSYTYRDYVVDAFNQDTPYDQFIKEQLAADQIVEGQAAGAPPAAETHDPRLAALGFLTVGRRYLNNNNDIIDDRIDVVTRGLLGLTVGCARCHDHKFDPIPTADYYSLFGVFASTTEPEELPIIGVPKNPVAYQQFLQELAKREAEVLKYEQESVPKVAQEIRDVAGDCFQQIARQLPAWAPIPAMFHGKNEPRGPIVQRWKDALSRTAAQPHPVLGTWHRLAAIAKAEEFPGEVNRLVDSWSNGEEAAKVNPRLRAAMTEQRPNTLVDLARIYDSLFRAAQGEWNELVKATPDAKQLPDSSMEELRQVLYDANSPANLTLDEARAIYGNDIRNMVTNLKRNVDNLKVTSPGAPPRAMVLSDGPIHEPVIFIRGNPGRHGNRVPRQFLAAASSSERKPFAKGSGRLELAEEIVAARNPLTARVIVNRIWQHHFGTGLVLTPSDFGTRGLPPTHPELLDWLAVETSGSSGTETSPSPHRWSIKRIHRLIVGSAVYQQSSTENAAARGRDPENRLLWRMPRIRLDFESFRDSLLAVAGKLDDVMGGQPFDAVMNPGTTRRTIYAFINRNDLPGVFRAFDFADIDTSAAERPQTTVPQQSLLAMNSPFIQEQARRLASDCHSASDDSAAQIQTLYRRIVSRDPNDEERQLSLAYLQSAQTTTTEKLSSLERLAQVLLMTNEFMFVD